MKKFPIRKRFRLIIPKYPALNIYSRIAISTTALGPICIATMVGRMKDWDAEVIDENNYRKFGPKKQDGQPDHDTLQAIRPADVAGFYGGLTSTVPRLYKLAKLYKQKGVVTIAGGQHFVESNIREALENSIDFVVIGEGEITIRELLNTLQQGEDLKNVAGIAFLNSNGNLVKTEDRQKITDFDSLPLPDFNLLRYSKMKLYPINWTRGCGMDCEFCTVKGRPRSSSPERVVEQIASLLEGHHARHFFIVDDLFGNKRADTLKLCDLLANYQKAVGVRLDITVQIRLDRAKDRELLRAMRKAGINTVCIGFESPISEELEAMNKKIKPEEMLKLTKLYHQAGFLVHGMFIFGYPLPKGVEVKMSLKERIKRFRKFIRQGKIDTLQVLLPVPIPGTGLTKRLNQDNRIFPLDYIGWKYYDGNFPLFVPDEPLTAEDMQTALKKIMGRFYRFRYIFAIARNILIFPAMMLTLWNIKFGWRKWYRHWRNDLIRFGGWIIIRRWKANFSKDPFSENLIKAKQSLQK
ncbi:MAG: hypothetical protein APR63_01620 [Desulfuromonas sp. SDB]|nr:MAG: hypothetical protein APR63_01620 [Desulfuromonas sp. SDB]